MADTPATPAAPAAAGQPDFFTQLAAALAAAGAGIGGKAIANAQGNPLTQAVPPQVSQLLDQSVARQAYQNPLFQATTQGVYDMLPDFAKNGTQLSGTLSNVAPAAPAQGSGGPGLGTAAGLGGLSALAGLLGNGSSSGGPLGPIFDAIKKLFHRNSGGTVQGNKPDAGGGLPSGNPGTTGFTGWDPNVSDPQGNPFLPSDPGFYVGGGVATDPSGGTGIGPGMQDYYNSGGGGGGSEPGAEGWWKP